MDTPEGLDSNLEIEEILNNDGELIGAQVTIEGQIPRILEKEQYEQVLQRLGKDLNESQQVELNLGRHASQVARKEGENDFECE